MRTLICCGAAIAAFLSPAMSLAAQPAPCPMLSDASASQALGTPTQGSAQEGMPSGLAGCDFVDAGGTINIISESGAFSSGAGAADLVQRYIPNLPPAALSQIQALQQAGTTIDVPGYHIVQVVGVGDAAIWVRSELVPGFFTDSLIVLRGTDAYVFNADDTPEA